MSDERPEGVCPICGLWQSDAETDPEQRARINAAFAGVKSGQLAEVRAEVERLREENAELRRLLNPPKDPHEWTPFDGAPEPVADSPPFPNETATMGSDG